MPVDEGAEALQAVEHRVIPRQLDLMPSLVQLELGRESDSCTTGNE